MEQLHLRPVVISEHVNLKRTEPQWQLALYVLGVFIARLLTFHRLENMT